jgi:hypothetical protein
MEAGLQGLAAISDTTLAGGGPVLAIRPMASTRIALAAAFGSAGGAFATRIELLGHFLLDPARQHGVGIYGIGGVAYVHDRADHGYLVVGAGAEWSPGGSRGWFAEGGIGGGWRLAAGYRWRWRRHHSR